MGLALKTNAGGLADSLVGVWSVVLPAKAKKDSSRMEVFIRHRVDRLSTRLDTGNNYLARPTAGKSRSRKLDFTFPVSAFIRH